MRGSSKNGNRFHQTGPRKAVVLLLGVRQVLMAVMPTSIISKMRKAKITSAPATKPARSSWIRMTAVYALCMACLVILGMPVRANAITKHAFYVSSQDGHVRELWSDGNGAWQGNDLTADTNGPVAATGGLTSFFDGSNEHVFYISSGDGHVRELFWNRTWQGYDLTTQTNGSVADLNGGLTSFFDGSSEHVFYISSGDWHVHELCWNGAWNDNDLTPDVSWPAAFFVNSVTSFYDGKFEHVFYVHNDIYGTSVCELYWDGTWHPSCQAASAQSTTLTSSFDGSTEYVFYVFYDAFRNGHLGELHYTEPNGAWQFSDLSANTSNPLPYASTLTSFYDGNVEHVFYLSQGGDICELYRNINGTWQLNDLTADTNGPAPSTSQLTAFVASDGTEHVFYVSVGDFHVRELYFNGAWHGNDLTADTNGPSASFPLTSFSTL